MSEPEPIETKPVEVTEPVATPDDPESREKHRLAIVAAAADVIRFKLHDVLSLDGTVDESTLSDEAKAAAERIVEEHFSDLGQILGLVSAIRRTVRLSCRLCVGRGIVRLSGAWEICDCVRVRLSDRMQRRMSVKIPGKQAAPVEARDKVAEAREILARAKQAQADACADLDGKIAAIELHNAGYFADRVDLDELRAAAGSCASEHHAAALRAAAAANAEVADARRARAEAIASPILAEPDDGEATLDRIELRPGYRRALVEVVVDRLSGALDRADLRRMDQAVAEAARDAAVTLEVECAAEIAALDVVNADVVAELSRLRRERERVAKHHAPKIEKAERRLRRVEYVNGNDNVVEGGRS